MPHQRHIFLIGYRGSGKSTVGRCVASELDRPFVDTDDQIESAAGKSIREIFESQGESGFRDLEQQVVALAATRPDPAVISLGGGAILREENRTQLKESGRCVWLKGSAENLFTRISGDATTSQRRPNLSDQGGYAEVVEVLAAREPIYHSLAEKIVLTDSQSPDEVVAEITAWVNSLAQ